MVRLPKFPWDDLVPVREEAVFAAQKYPTGLIDLSIGSPIDPAPESVAQILADAANGGTLPGYPVVEGIPELQQAVIDWYARRRDVPVMKPKNVVPTIGSKELVATLALALKIGPGDVVVQPELAYPTYEIGAVLAGAEIVSEDNPDKWPANTKLVWLNAPGNPNGNTYTIPELKRRVDRARELGAVIVNDECYLELGWEGNVPTILHPEVVGVNFSDVLSVYSLSKQSNLAGLRAAFVAGCGGRINQIIRLRKHMGLMVPTPVQQVMANILYRDDLVEAQREIYAHRRAIVKDALESFGFRIDDSQAGLYLWATANEDSWKSVSRLAKRGILVTPGDFYGPKGSQHIRVSLTAPDTQIASIEQRLK